MLGVRLIGFWGPRAAALLVLLASPAVAQTSQPAPPAAESAPAKPADNPGLLNEIGKLLTAPAALLPSLKPSEPVNAPAPVEAQKDVPAAGSRIVPGIVSGREMCLRSENSGPDCKAASDRLCRGNGYTTGKSLDTDETYNCSARPLQAKGKLCGNDTFVTRAFCQ